MFLWLVLHDFSPFNLGVSSLLNLLTLVYTQTYLKIRFGVLTVRFYGFFKKYDHFNDSYRGSSF